MGELKDELLALKQEMAEGLDNISGDITRLSERLDGGLTADEAALVKAEFQGIAERIKTIAAITPEPVVEDEEGEGEGEGTTEE